MFLQHDNFRPHVKTYLEKVYSSDIRPFDYHLFRSMSHGLADQQYCKYDITKWLASWIASKENTFT